MLASRPKGREPLQPLLTRAKLQVPNPDAAALDRPELLELLERHAGRPLTRPPLALERMRVRGELFELDAGRLRLNRTEMWELLGRALGREPAPAELERLDEASAGWPTAVQLALEALRREPARGLDTVLADLRVPDLELQAFFSAEVYRRLEPASRELLERSAVLDRFDAPLATLLSGQRDA